MTETLVRGRKSYEGRVWAEAYRCLALADEQTPLDADDLERLAVAAYLTGREDVCLHAFERAHDAHARGGSRPRAIRCAFWLGLVLLFRGEAGHGSGWLARAQRMLGDQDCVERGYLQLPAAEQALGGGRIDAAREAAAAAVAIGERFGDPDLVACARHLEGRARIEQGEVQAGLALLDESMLAVVSGALSPMVTGLVYCSVIEACQRVSAVGRAREWTDALSRWCDGQPDLVAFTGACLVRRAEVMQFHGAWPDALAEAARACERARQLGRTPPAGAYYEQGEIHRLRGELRAAEEAYRAESRLGREPQPGLALLRAAQGRLDAACAAIRRVLVATPDRLERARLLPAAVEIALAAGDVEEADRASGELEALAEAFDIDVLRTASQAARGAVLLEQNDPRAALPPLRRAFERWQQVDAPYEAARVRVLIGLACRSLDDEETAALELAAAGGVFQQLGAAPDLTRLGAQDRRGGPALRPRLTSRELEVLRLVAAGRTNKAIAAALSLSERTVDRHLSNIFNKLSVTTRTAATAYAYQHRLL